MNTSSGMEIEVALGRGRKKVDPGRAPFAPKISRVTRLMALAIKFQDMIDRGELRDYADLARLGFVSRARVTQIMNLLLLAPEFEEAILKGNFCPTERLLRSAKSSLLWSDQRQFLPFGRAIAP